MMCMKGLPVEEALVPAGKGFRRPGMKQPRFLAESRVPGAGHADDSDEIAVCRSGDRGRKGGNGERRLAVHIPKTGRESPRIDKRFFNKQGGLHEQGRFDR